MASFISQMQAIYLEGDSHAFRELGKGKDLSRILKTADKAMFDFYGYKGESIAAKDHGDMMPDCSKLDYVVNGVLFMVKGIIRSLLVMSSDNSQADRLRELMWEFSKMDSDFSCESGKKLSIKQMVYVFEEKAIRNSLFRGNFVRFLQDHVSKKYNKSHTLESFIDSLWKKNSLIDSAAFLVKIIIVDFGIPSNIYVSAGTQKKPILNYMDLFGVMPALVLIIELNNQRIGLIYGLSHTETYRDLEVDDPFTGGNAPGLRSPTSMVSVTPSSGLLLSAKQASHATLRGVNDSDPELEVSPILSDKMSYEEDKGILDKFMCLFSNKKKVEAEVNPIRKEEMRLSYQEPPKEIMLKTPNRATRDRLPLTKHDFHPIELNPFNQQSMISKGSLTSGAYVQKINEVNEQRRREPRPSPDDAHYLSYQDSSVDDSFLDKLFAFARNPFETNSDNNDNADISFKGSIANSNGQYQPETYAQRSIANAFDHPVAIDSNSLTSLDFNPFKASNTENERYGQNDIHEPANQYDQYEALSLSKRDRPNEAYAVNYQSADMGYGYAGSFSRPVENIPMSYTHKEEPHNQIRDEPYTPIGEYQLDAPKGISYADRYFANLNADGRTPTKNSYEVRNKWLEKNPSQPQPALNPQQNQYNENLRTDLFNQEYKPVSPISYTAEYMKNRQENDVRSIWSYNQSNTGANIPPANDHQPLTSDYAHQLTENNVFEGKSNNNVLDFSLGSLFNVLNGNTDLLVQQRVPQTIIQAPRPPVSGISQGRLLLHETDPQYTYNRDTMKESNTIRIYSNSPPRRLY